MNTLLKFFFLFFVLSMSAAKAGAAKAEVNYVSIDKVIAIVDDSVITQSDLHDAEKQVKMSIEQQQHPVPDKATLRKMAMDNLILEKIQLQMAQRAGVFISEQELTHAMKTLAERKGMSLEQMANDFKKKGESFSNLRSQVKKELAIQQVQQSYLRNRININEQAIDDYLNSHEGKERIQAKYAISHILLKLDDNPSAKEKARAKQTIEQVAANIKAGKRQYSDFNSPQTINGFTISNGDLGVRTQDQLPTLFADIVPKMKPGALSLPVLSGAGWNIVKLDRLEGTAKIVHQVHARHILIKLSEVRDNAQAKRLADDLYKRLKKGGDFSLLAKEYSDDTGSALQGGDLGWSEADKYVGAFKDKLLTLKDGEISKPFKSEFGWHIAQKLGERDHNVTEELRKNRAFQVLYQRKAAEEIDAWLGQIRDAAFIEYKVPQDKPDNTKKPVLSK